jgi:anti-sigma factor RsiW
MQVSAYVDGQLDARTTRAFDQHLVACQVCRHAAEQERRILRSLRTGATPCLSEGLQSMLLGLAAPVHPTAAQELRGGVPAIPPAPRGVRPARVPLPTVAPAAPALHRSPRRAAMFAGLAAGASAAAAIGLAVATPGTVTPSPSSPSRTPVARVPGASVTADTAALLTWRRNSPASVFENRAFESSVFQAPAVFQNPAVEAPVLQDAEQPGP